jgi:hypothetical protein
MKTIFLNGNKFEWNGIVKLREEAKKYRISIGQGVRIYSNVSIGSDVSIWSGATIGSNAYIGSGARIRTVKGIVYKAQHLNGLYQYEQDIIYTDKDIYIRMGCLTLTVDKWKKNFWNNDKEFPDDGNERSVDRLEAFNVCMRILKLDEIKG